MKHQTKPSVLFAIVKTDSKMWIKINSQIINAISIRYISEVQEVTPERFHADKMDEWRPFELSESNFPLALKWRDGLMRTMLCLGTETMMKPSGVNYSRWRVIKTNCRSWRGCEGRIR